METVKIFEYYISQVLYGAAKISHEEKVMRKFLHLRKMATKISQVKKSDAKFLFSLVQLPSNGYNFFI